MNGVRACGRGGGGIVASMDMSPGASFHLRCGVRYDLTVIVTLSNKF